MIKETIEKEISDEKKFTNTHTNDFYFKQLQ